MIVLYYSWLTSRSVNAWGISVCFLLCQQSCSDSSLYFLLFSIIFFIIPVVKENTRLKLALAIPTETPIIPVKSMIDIPLLVADKTIRILSK